MEFICLVMCEFINYFSEMHIPKTFNYIFFKKSTVIKNH